MDASSGNAGNFYPVPVVNIYIMMISHRGSVEFDVAPRRKHTLLFAAGAVALALLGAMTACGSEASGNLALTREPAARESAAESIPADVGLGSRSSPSAMPTTVALSQAPAQQENTPSAPGATVLVTVVDEQGQPVEQGDVEISVEYQDNPQYNFAYAVELSSLLPSGLLPLDPPSRDVAATVSIHVVTPAGETTDTLVVSGGFWEAVVATDLDYVAVHEFDLSKSGTTSSVAYIAEHQP